MTSQSIGIRITDLLEKVNDRKIIFYCIAAVVSILLGVFVVLALPLIPPLYILLGFAGLLIAYLLLFHIEVGVILAIFVLYESSRFNYMGGGTPFHPNGLLGIAIIGATIVFFLSHKIDYSRLIGIIPYFGFWAICVFSLAFTGNNLMEGVTITLRLMTGLSIYAVLTYKLDSIKMVKWVLLAVAGSQISPLISRLLNYRGYEVASEYGLVRIGTSAVGVYLAMFLTLSLVQIINARRKPERFLWGGFAGLFAVGLFLSYGRAGWISFIVALVVIGLLRYKKLLVVLPVILILLVLLVPAISQRFSDISVDALTDRNSSTLGARIEVWKGALEIAKNSLIFGVGYGVGRYRVGELLGQYSWMIHNDYLSVLLETGVLGLILFLVWQGHWLISIFNVFRKSKVEYDKILSLGILAIFVASLVSRITDNSLQDSYRLYFLSALVAVALTLPRVRANEEAKAALSSVNEKI